MKKNIFNLAVLFLISSLLLIILTGCSNNETNIQTDNSNASIINEENKDNTERKTEGNLAKIITSKNYGDKINYSANNIDDWKIFYNDGENVFIITERNIPNTYIPTDIGLDNQSKYMGSFEVYWDYKNFVYPGISTINSSVIEKYMFSWAKEYPNSEIYTAKSAASLMDTNKWAMYVDSSVAESAIGTPTLDMFIESWNQVEDRKIYYNSTNDTGYYIGNTSKPEDYDISIFNKPEIEEGKGNEFYLVNKELSYGYWLIAPSAKGEEWMVAVNKYGLDVEDSWSPGNGLRPVVCLNSNVNGKFENETWTLNK